MEKMVDNVEIHSGMVSIVGRPNVGKSTLLNKILGEKVAIVSRVPQTTRNQVRGIYNRDNAQVVFIDTPGLHKGRDQLDKFMNKASDGTIAQADCLIYLVDATRRIGEEEQAIAEKLKTFSKPLILGLNKMDIKKADIGAYISFWEEVKGCSVSEMKNFTLMPLSGKEGFNVDKLLDVVVDYLPTGMPMYPRDAICDVPQRMAIADIIREKLFQAMSQEVPHALGVVIEEIRPVKGKTMMIRALILVERATQKEIVIGKGGSMLKKIGTYARQDLEELLDSKVFLECHVKTRARWRDQVSILQELGYDERFV